MSSSSIFHAPRHRWAVCLPLVFLLACAALGCGSDGSPCSVSGSVTFDGAPIVDGDIRFNPIGDTPGPGGSAEIKDGKYAVPIAQGMCAGKHRVLMTATRSTGRMVRVENLSGGPAEMEHIEQYIPEQYNRRSTLELDAQPGDNSKDFALTK